MQNRKEARRVVKELHGSYIHGFKVRREDNIKMFFHNYIFQVKVEMSQDKERGGEKSSSTPRSYRKRNSVSSIFSASDCNSEDENNKVKSKISDIHKLRRASPSSSGSSMSSNSKGSLEERRKWKKKSCKEYHYRK